MAILRGESSTNKIKTNNNKEFNRPQRRIIDTQRAQRTNTKTRKMIFTARVVRPTRRRIFDSEAKDVRHVASSTKRAKKIKKSVENLVVYFLPSQGDLGKEGGGAGRIVV